MIDGKLAAFTGEGEAGDPAVTWSGSRPMLTQEEATDPDYIQQALIPFSSETHGPEDVAVYAKGPFAHLLDGVVEQNYIFHVMHHAVTVE
jgi:alkaline phosphatase